ncbi:MAG: nucleoside kinase, partial [Clostridiales bacterium]|nr:nucleoside kinase [Clostridiales bacterium]
MNHQKELTIEIVGAEKITVKKGTTVGALAQNYAGLCAYPILAAKVNHELYELHRRLIEDGTVEWIDISSQSGFRVYQRTAAFIMICAAQKVIGKDARIVIEHSINKNYYCELISDTVSVTDELLEEIGAAMRAMIAEDMPIEKISLSLEEGINLCKELGALDKAQMLKYRRTSHVNFYKLNGCYDYFYGQLANHTGAVSLFELSREGRGFLLQFPSSTNPNRIAPKKELGKIISVFSESNQWAKILKADMVGSLNGIICGGGQGDFIRTNEALHEKKIASIADQIHDQKKRIILIAGPSSSGKTTFAERLSIQLRVNGLRPHVISLDNYFVNRELTPLDEFGQINFEDLYAIDVKKVNDDLEQLLNGETIQMPTFNFVSGQREFKGNYLTLGAADVLVIEGLHALNEKVSERIPKDDKFKIFISALTQLNLDDHNRIPTTDTRLIRRLVRDSQFRGFGAVKTLSVWASVGRGEDKYIFPFQQEADAMFNSALVYEMCVLKQFAEPLLFQIDRSLPEYTEAKRLVKFLDSFIGISSEGVP